MKKDGQRRKPRDRDGDGRRRFLGSRQLARGRRERRTTARGDAVDERTASDGEREEGRPFPLSCGSTHTASPPLPSPRLLPLLPLLPPPPPPSLSLSRAEARNLATVARYNRYCGRRLNGGELELGSHTFSARTYIAPLAATPLGRTEESDPSLSNPCTSRSVSLPLALVHPYYVLRSIAPSPHSAQPCLPPALPPLSVLPFHQMAAERVAVFSL